MNNSFLVRFTLVTAVVTGLAALVLSYLLSASHLQALRNDLVASSVGQVSALVTPALATIGKNGTVPKSAYANLATSTQQAENFLEYVRQVQLYLPDGQPLYPAHAPAEVQSVRNAIASQSIVQNAPRNVLGERIFTVYAPLTNPNGSGYAAVLALNISADQLGAQDASEQRFVILTTIGVLILIFLSLVTLAAAAQRELNRRQHLADDTFLQTMEGVASIVDKRDRYTAGHSKRVADYSAMLGRELKLSAAEITTIYHAALLHDIGKIGIPDAVLLKPARLEPSERTIIELHPQIAGEILAGVEAMRAVCPCIVHHHERVDGKGYPLGLTGERIPFGARVIAVADTFDAMTTDRPYRRALDVPTARAELVRVAGQQLDERCVAHFIHILDRNEITPPPPIEDDDERANTFGQHLPPVFAS